MNHKGSLAQVIGLTFLLFLLVACGKTEPTPTAVPPTARPALVSLTSTPTVTNTPSSRGTDYWPTEGWRTSTPEEQGMDSERLANMLDLIMELNHDIHSVTIIRNGYIVADATIYPFVQDSKHIIHSATKSIVSALIGIAIEQGYIEGVDQPVLSLFPDRTAANVDANKEAMTLEHLLMMAAGLECRDSYLYRHRGMDEMAQTDDWIQFMLDLPMAEPPGTRFEYCNGASFLLSAIIQETTGMTAAEFAEINLFGHLGITDVIWPHNPQGISIGWGDLRMRPHDMAKIGYLYLNEGRWDGEQIIPSTWVDTSTSKHIDATLLDGYGYQWWTTNEDYYMALGAAGQYIFVAPEHELVTVFTSNLIKDDSSLPDFLHEYYILPAVNSDSPLPPNPGGVDSLDSRIQKAALSQSEPEPIPPLPEIAQRVTGKTFLLDPNPIGWESISLTFQDEEEASLTLTISPDIAQELVVDPLFQSQMELPVGLDNVYRFAPSEFGINAGLKGEWLSEDVFVIDYDLIGNTGQGRLQFTFEGDQFTLKFQGRDQPTVIINGQLEG